MIEYCDKCHDVVFDSKDEKRYQPTKIINDLLLCENCQELNIEYEYYRTDID